VRRHRVTVASRRPGLRVGPGVHERLKVIDVGIALDLLGAVAERYGDEFVYRPASMEPARYLTCGYVSRSQSDCVVGQALALAGVSAAELDAMGDAGLKDIYLQGKCPVRLTLGALAVLRAAQDSQDRGSRWGDVLAHATAAARRILDIVPDSAFRLAQR
jgi:hypothetical protein